MAHMDWRWTQSSGSPQEYRGESCDPPTVLLVDDDNSIRKVLYEYLEEGGYNVLSAANGADALGICRRFRHPIALLLTDVEMPGMSGPELVEQALRLRPLMRILFMSGGAPGGASGTTCFGPTSPILAKPFKGGALMDRIKHALSRQ